MRPSEQKKWFLIDKSPVCLMQLKNISDVSDCFSAQKLIDKMTDLSMSTTSVLQR